MWRSLFVLVVALGALAQGPATAAPTTPGPSSSADVHPEWGSTTGHDAKIRERCRGYAYDYSVHPPDGYWSLETFLVGRDGRTYGSGYFQVNGNPTTGQGEFRLCGRSTPGGRFTIRALLTVDDASGNTTQSGWLPDSSFRLRHRRH